MNINRLFLIGVFFTLSGSCLAIEEKPALINFGTEDGGNIEASFFESSHGNNETRHPCL
jgi:hypothetical protein